MISTFQKSKKPKIDPFHVKIGVFRHFLTQRAEKNIKSPFNKAVQTIINCKKGKVIISGVGKSGIIA